MKQQVQLLNDRLAKIEADARQGQEELQKMIARAQTQVTNMEEALSRATMVLARNSADFGAELEEAKTELNRAEGTMAELTHSMEALTRKVEDSSRRINEFALAAGLDLPVDESTVPPEAKDHMQMMKDSLSAGRYGEMRSLAKLYQDRYPRAKDLEEVQLMIGRSHIAQKQYAKALGALRRFVDLFPKSPRMPEVLYEMANAFFMLGDCTDARILVDTLETRHGGTPAASKAVKLKELMTSQPAKCTS
jgi:TolA-binding protein